MKPAPFDYAAPRSVDDALSLLEREDSRALAGGQSLVPMLNFRLARPALVVDLNGLSELSYLRRVGDRALLIGALTRQVTLERSELVQRDWPLLAQAVRMVGHPAIRSRGTVGGSVAHADPRAELPAALVALDARFGVRSRRGERWFAAAEFFRMPFTTAIADDELLTVVSVPPLPAGARTAFVEQTRTHGDFALAGAAVVVAPGEHAAITLVGAGGIPVRATSAERALVAGAPADSVAELAVEAVADEYRRALLAATVRGAIGGAMS